MTTRNQLVGQIQRPGQRPESVDLAIDSNTFRFISPIVWNENTIYDSTSIPANRNARSHGPIITIYNGVTVGVGQNTTWTIE